MRWIRYLSPHHNCQQGLRAEWCEEPQALTLFGQVKSDIIHRTAFWAVTVMVEFTGKRASGEMVFDAEREIYFPAPTPSAG